MSPQKKDLLIIGGGPAGSVAAFLADQFKFSAAIIERESFPRDKVCGDGIFLSCFDFLEQIGISKSQFKNSGYQCEKVHLFDSKKNKIELATNFKTITRQEFDGMLWDNIPDSIPKMESSKIISIKKLNSTYLTTLEKNKEQFQIESNYLIGADGYSSLVKRKFFPKLNYELGIASRSYIHDESLTIDDFQFYFEDDLIPGYFWCFKIADHQYNTGVYIRSEQKNKIADLHSYYLKKHLNCILDKNNFDTWSIPNNTDFTELANENALLIGDAAGLCDKLAGHGIDAAIISAFVALKSINDFQLKKSNFDLQEIYRYHLTQYFSESLLTSKLVAEKIQQEPENCIQIFKSFLDQIK